MSTEEQTLCQKPGCRVRRPAREVPTMKTWDQLTAEYRRLIEERDNLLSQLQGEPTPAEQGRLELIAGSIPNLLQEPVDGPRDEP